jgi:hypothetical protein
MQREQSMSASSSGGRTQKRSLDSPTYLRITRQISEEEYQRRLDQRRERMGLPRIERERPATG